MVGKSQTGFIYRGNTEHLGRSRSICKIGPRNRAFPSAFWSLGARRDRPVIVVQEQRQNSRYGKGVAVEVAQFRLLKALIVYVLIMYI